MNLRSLIDLRFVLALVAISVVACEQQSPSEIAQKKHGTPELDPGRIRVAIVDGLEAAIRDPAVIQQLGLDARLEDPQVVAAFERLLARATADPELGRIADEFFVTLQDSPAMRAALLEHAKQNQKFVESDLSALRETFISTVEQRLTRPELAELLEQQLRLSMRGTGEVLAKAWTSEAGGASALADRVLAELDRAEVRGQFASLLGRDDLQLQLVRRFADGGRASQFLASLSPVSTKLLVEILDHELASALLARSLARVLRDEQVRQRCEDLFALALADEFDEATFTDELAQLLNEPVLAQEALAFTRAVASEEFARKAVAAEVAQLHALGGFDVTVMRIFG